MQAGLRLFVFAVAVSAALAQDTSPREPAAEPTDDPAPVHPRVQIETDLGEFVVELDSEKAPKSVENFLKYVDAKYYDGTIFHRIIGKFMIQAGGFTAIGEPKPSELHETPVENEGNNGLKNVRGAIAMARSKKPNSATSQFFINVVDNPKLDYPSPDGSGYAVFGRVISGMDVVDRIKSVEVRAASTGELSQPISPPTIRSARRVNRPAETSRPAPEETDNDNEDGERAP